MKASRLESYLQEVIGIVVSDDCEHDEVGLGFDAMLSHDVVKFLLTDHSIAKPLIPRATFKQNAVLDEHELAMV